LMTRYARYRANNRPIDKALNKCGKWTYEGVFSDPKIRSHRLRIKTKGAKGKWRIRLRVTKGRWKPKLAIRSGGENKIHTGVRARSWARRSYKIKTMHTGRKGSKAEFVLVPKGRDLILYMSAWGRRRPPKNAGYSLEIQRKCK
jgi:hypothetical protein